jgi:hypothetical protein
MWPSPHEGIQYPANFLRLSTLEEKEAIGITEVPDPPTWDQRFYWGPDLPKDHTQLVEQWVSQTRITAGTLTTAPSYLKALKIARRHPPSNRPEKRCYRSHHRHR